ncbi:MAG: peptidase T [Spirochaetales bacterium]
MSLQDLSTEREWYERDLLARFLRYVQVHTTSDPHVAVTPSTERQFDLARMLEAELRELGVLDVTLDENCRLIARLPGKGAEEDATPIGFMAHVDTAPDFSGENVRPQVHESYDGGPISLNDEHQLDPDSYPMLLHYTGETIITTDGTTLLGADDKAGIAEIMTAVRFLIAHPEIPRPPIEIIFTPDEETGRGMNGFPVEKLQSKFCFTMDGTDEGGIEAACFTAYRVSAEFTGYSIHPGSARGKLANAASMAAQFVAMLPRSESPEATDGDFGFYCPTEITGSISAARVNTIVRDFNHEEAKRRLAFLEQLARTVEGAFPGGRIKLETTRQYLNMADFLEPHPHVVDNISEAIRATGMEPSVHKIRGGTDGARLSEMGIPTPNIFTGGQNLHGRFEWIALPAMVRAAKTVVNLAYLFSK